MIKICLCLWLLLGLVGCDSSHEEISVIMPSGAPSLAHIEIEYDLYSRGIHPQNDIVFGADPLLSAFQNETHDVIIGPFNLGINMIEQARKPYQLAAVITWGNLLMVSHETLTDLEDLNGKELVMFGESSMPDFTVQALLDAVDFDQPPSMQYVDSLDMAVAKVQADQNVIALVAEPRASVLLKQNPDLYVLDIQTMWESYFDMAGYPQAAVFVHRTLSDDVVKAYLTQLKKSIDFVHENPAEAALYAETLDGYPFASDVLKDAIPGSHIRYASAQEAQDAIEAYINIILLSNPDAPLKIPSEQTYGGS